MEEWAVDKEEVGILRERVEEAARLAVNELRETSDTKGAKGAGSRKRKHADARKSGGGDDRDRDDDEFEAGMAGISKTKKARSDR